MSDKKSILALEKLLASYNIFYLNLRGYHWNLIGDGFFDLHPQFETFYDEMEETIDVVAERLRGLGEFVSADYTEYAKISIIGSSKVKKAGISGHDALNEAMVGFEKLIELKKEAVVLFGVEKDYGTVELLSEQLLSEEKSLWMIKAYLKK